MNVHATGWTMISDITPESAYRVAENGAAVWRLSWLPHRLLTREQALAGMELDEIISDPDAVYDRVAQAQAAARADQLGILWEQAVIMLSKRMMARLEDPDGPAPAEAPLGDPAPGPRSFRSHRYSMHSNGPPHVYG